MKKLRGRQPGPVCCFEGEVRQRSGRFAVVSDLQRTSRAEVWRESNRDERERVLREIARERPDFVTVLGDLVFRGSAAAEWEELDRVCAPLREARLPVLPVLGNHEYWVSRRGALPRFFARFPHLEKRHWYSVPYGPLGLVFLDSNLRWLPAAQWQEQLEWYERELLRLDEDPTVRGVVVFLHHPPYTNSTVTPDERHVQRFFVPPFVRAGKTLAMVSGHVHSYERFQREGKAFIVSGGGGGPRVRLATGARRRHQDDLFAGPPVRPFHFMMISVGEDGLEVEVKGLEKKGSEFQLIDSFVLRWQESEARMTS